MLGAGIRSLPLTDDPAADLVVAGSVLFRRFALQHPVLFRVGIQRACIEPELGRQFEAARLNALAGLEARLRRLQKAHRLAGRSVRDAASAFHALCEGLTEMELRGAIVAGQEERLWKDAFSALVAGLATPPAEAIRETTGLAPNASAQGDPDALPGTSLSAALIRPGGNLLR